MEGVPGKHDCSITRRGLYPWSKVQKFIIKTQVKSTIRRSNTSGRAISQAYIPKRRTLIQALPSANAYTKYAHAYIHFVKSSCCLLMRILLVYTLSV